MSTAVLFLILILTAAAAAAGTTTATDIFIGVNYVRNPPQHLMDVMNTVDINAFRVPSITLKELKDSPFPISITIPNKDIMSISSNPVAADSWVKENVMPYYRSVEIRSISVGQNFTEGELLLPAMVNVRESLHANGVEHVIVTTTLDVSVVVEMPFPPSSAHFTGDATSYIEPLLAHLSKTNTPLFITVYPHIYQQEIPFGFLLFDKQQLNYRFDPITHIKYDNVFDMMVDGMINAMFSEGHPYIPLVIAETGWPSMNKTDIRPKKFIQRVFHHTRLGQGSPSRKEAVAEVYLNMLFDTDTDTDTEGNDKKREANSWLIWYQNIVSFYKAEAVNCPGCQRYNLKPTLSLETLKIVFSFTICLLGLIMFFVVWTEGTPGLQCPQGLCS